MRRNPYCPYMGWDVYPDGDGVSAVRFGVDIRARNVDEIHEMIKLRPSFFPFLELLGKPKK